LAGWSEEKIANQLEIKPKTVQWHLRSMLNLCEHCQQRIMPPLESLKIFWLSKCHEGFTQLQVASMVGKTPRTVRRAVRLCETKYALQIRDLNLHRIKIKAKIIYMGKLDV